MVFEGYSFTEQINDITTENEHNATEIEEMESYIDTLTAECDALENDYQRAREVIVNALSDLATLSEVPLNLIEAAIDNIMDDLRKAI